MAVRVLSFHASYRCRQTGVCCDFGWPIPVEDGPSSAIETALADGRLGPRRADVSGLRKPDRPGTWLPMADDGRCTFFDRGAHASCRVHSALGHGALPLACRQFPRVTVTDPRGASVTLSHVCPTAASLLESDAAVTIDTGGPGFPSDGEYVGLDARDALPPLLRADMAMDWESWWTLEGRVVDRIANGTGPLDDDLAKVRAAVADVRTWSPADGPLDARIDAAFARGDRRGPSVDAAGALAMVRASIPAELSGAAPSAPAGTAATTDGVRRRFLAAHAFASWTAYLADDISAWTTSLDIVHTLAGDGWSPGQIDLVVRHLAVPGDLARGLSGSSQ